VYDAFIVKKLAETSKVLSITLNGIPDVRNSCFYVTLTGLARLNKDKYCGFVEDRGNAYLKKSTLLWKSADSFWVK